MRVTRNSGGKANSLIASCWMHLARDRRDSPPSRHQMAAPRRRYRGISELQREILDAMWQQLKPGGSLVYATCSITPQENRLQVKAFLERTPDARLVGSDPAQPGRQILPGEEAMDGFLLRRIKQTTLIRSTKVSHNSPWA